MSHTLLDFTSHSAKQEHDIYPKRHLGALWPPVSEKAALVCGRGTLKVHSCRNANEIQ